MLSLVADYDTTSSSSSSDEEEGTDENSAKKEDKSSKANNPSSSLVLPSANLLLNGGLQKTTGDVFNNPFLEAEKLEIDKLQKHVKMVDSEEHLIQKNGRKICWNNRKGRCRFGNKCKYAHDSDLVEAGEVSKVNVNKVSKSHSLNNFSAMPGVTTNNSKDKLKTRKRPGLGDSIVPGKRVMKTYQNAKKSTL
ncbi:uncharacterized protein ACRADG_011674 [Cochliomyia hominivorax]